MDDGAAVPRTPGELAIDTGLLRAFRYACRPDCGLCCFASPRTTPEEIVTLRRLDPSLRWVERGRDRFLSSRPDGGACQALAAHRCRVHAARPHPCREFPVTVHVGHRLQASLVLSCPGIELSALRAVPARSRDSLPEPLGLDAELRALRERLDSSVARRMREASRRGRAIERRLRREGRWRDDAEVRAELGHAVPLPVDEDFPVEPPPRRADGLEHLPLFFDGREGPVGLADSIGGWEALELSERGGGETRGLFVPPDRVPPLEREAEALLRGYLAYWLERDSFLASVHLEMLEADAGDVVAWAADALREVGAQTLARASVRRKLDRGEEGRLAVSDVERGITATDQDWLDRPTWGDRY